MQYFFPLLEQWRIRDVRKENSSQYHKSCQNHHTSVLEYNPNLSSKVKINRKIINIIPSFHCTLPKSVIARLFCKFQSSRFSDSNGGTIFDKGLRKREGRKTIRQEIKNYENLTLFFMQTDLLFWAGLY